MKSLSLIFLVSLIGLSTSLQADPPRELNKNWMRKASMLLLGRDDLSAYQTFRGNETAAEKRAIIQKLQVSDAYRRKMQGHVLENLGFITVEPSEYKFTANTVTPFINSILAQNQPWSSLFASREVRINPKRPNDFAFYSRVFPELTKMDAPTGENNDSSDEESNAELAFNEDQSYMHLAAKTPTQRAVLAGVITTPEFFRRYFNTNTNENFKRAAALYRILMCDDMKPVIISDQSFENALLAQAIADLNKTVKAVVPASSAADDQHGNQDGCTTCHRKLTPTAKLFATSPVLPAAKPVPSKFVWGTEEKPALGLGEWVDNATKTDTYKQCQVRFFWNLVIGQNVPISEDAMSEMLNTFKSSRENFNVMIETLMLRQEFSAPAQELEHKVVTLRDVRPLLRRCDSCHADQFIVPSFTSFPIGGSWAEHDRWLAKIVKETDLEHFGENAVMPPAKAGWKPTGMEFRMLKRWLLTGARDEKSQRTSQAKLVSPENVNLGLKQATFNPTFRRFLKIKDLQKVASEFPSNSYGECEIVDLFAPLGAYDSTKLGPVLEVPGPDYFTFVAKCIAPGLAQRVTKGGTREEVAREAFEIVFGKSRFSVSQREKIIYRILKKVSKDASSDKWALQFATGFATSPEFLTY